MTRAPSPAQFLARSRLTPHRLHLPGTALVELHPDPRQDLVLFGGYLQAGRLLDPAEHPGLCHLLAHMLGTERPGCAVNLRQDASLVFASSADRVNLNVELKCLAEDALPCAARLIEHLRTPFDLLAMTANRGVLDEHKLQVARTLMRQGQQASTLAVHTLQQLSYPAPHPYHAPEAGELEPLARVTPDALASFHRTHVLGSPLALVVSGHFDPVSMTDTLQQAFEGWDAPQKSRPHVPPAPLAPGTTVRLPRSTGALQYLLLGQASVGRDHPQWTAYALLNHLLARAHGGGRLAARLRHARGATYHLDCHFDGGWRTGLWRCGGWFTPEDVLWAITVIEEELTRLHDEPVSDLELDSSRKAIAMAIMTTLSTHDGLVRERLGAHFYGLGDDHLERTHERLQGVTAHDVQAAARTLTPDTLHRVIVG